MPAERLQRMLARAGVASRRASEELIRQGRVAVNGSTVTEMGVQVDAERDVITVDGQQISASTSSNRQHIYLALYKPAGYVSTVHDPEGRSTVLDLIPPEMSGDTRLYPVGRLDYDSEGMLLLTNDGEFTNRMTHPRYAPPKEYEVLTDRAPSVQELQLLRNGIVLDDRRTARAEVDILEVRQDKTAWILFILQEGRNRQIRRMCDAVGLTVLRLVRVRIGSIDIDSMRPGQVRRLRPHEVQTLLNATKVE